MKEPDWLERVVEVFSNETDRLIDEFVLPKLELSELQRVWNAAASDPMVELFLITPNEAPFFRNLLSVDFDFDHYSYFMGAYTIDWNATKLDGGYMGLFPPSRILRAFPDARRVKPKVR